MWGSLGRIIIWFNYFFGWVLNRFRRPIGALSGNFFGLFLWVQMRKVFFLIFDSSQDAFRYILEFWEAWQSSWNHIKIVLKSCWGRVAFWCDCFNGFGIILSVKGGPFWVQISNKMHSKFDQNFDDFLIPSGARSAGGSEPPWGPFWHLEARFLGARLLEG